MALTDKEKMEKYYSELEGYTPELFDKYLELINKGVLRRDDWNIFVKRGADYYNSPAFLRQQEITKKYSSYGAVNENFDMNALSGNIANQKGGDHFIVNHDEFQGEDLKIVYECFVCKNSLVFVKYGMNQKEYRKKPLKIENSYHKECLECGNNNFVLVNFFKYYNSDYRRCFPIKEEDDQLVVVRNNGKYYTIERGLNELAKGIEAIYECNHCEKEIVKNFSISDYKIYKNPKFLNSEKLSSEYLVCECGKSDATLRYLRYLRYK